MFFVRFKLKTKILLILLAFGLVSMVSAQAQGHGRTSPRFPAAETVTVSGSLVVAYGLPAVKSGDGTYLVGGINRFVGFIDGLKEGAQVTIEGLAVTSPKNSEIKFLKPSKMTLNGKSYDLALPRGDFGFRRPNMGRFNFSAPPSFRQHSPGVPGNQGEHRRQFEPEKL